MASVIDKLATKMRALMRDSFLVMFSSWEKVLHYQNLLSFLLFANASDCKTSKLFLYMIFIFCLIQL